MLDHFWTSESGLLALQPKHVPLLIHTCHPIISYNMEFAVINLLSINERTDKPRKQPNTPWHLVQEPDHSGSRSFHSRGISTIDIACPCYGVRRY